MATVFTLQEANSPAIVVSYSDGTTDVIAIDAIPKETHTIANEVTDHPAEQGMNFADHSRPLPDRVALECVVTNTPLSGTAPADGESRADQTWRKLTALHNAPALVSVFTSLGTYTSMAIESVTVPREARNANALQFSVNLKRVRIVQNKQTRIVVARSTRAQPKKSNGTAQSADPAAKGVNRSRLAAAADATDGKTGLAKWGAFGGALLTGGN